MVLTFKISKNGEQSISFIIVPSLYFVSAVFAATNTCLTWNGV